MALPLLLAAAPSIIKGISGIVQSRKGNRLARANKRPDYEIPQEFTENAEIASNMARTGLPQQQYNNAVNNINKNQAGAYRQVGRIPNTGSLASIVRAGNDATLELDAKDASARIGNQRFALGQRGILGGQKLAKQNWDKLQLYEENATAAEALKGSGRQNMFGGLSDLSGLGQLSIMSGIGDSTTGALSGSTGGSMTNPSATANAWMKANLGKSAFPKNKSKLLSNYGY